MQNNRLSNYRHSQAFAALVNGVVQQPQPLMSTMAGDLLQRESEWLQKTAADRITEMESRLTSTEQACQASADRITSVKLQMHTLKNQMHTLQGEFWKSERSQNEINAKMDKKILELQKAVDEFESTQRQVAQKEMKCTPEKIDSKLNCLRDWVNHLRFSNKTLESKLDVLRSKMVQQKFDYPLYDYPDSDAGLEPAGHYHFSPRFQYQ